MGTCQKCKCSGPNLDLLTQKLWELSQGTYVVMSSRWFLCMLQFESPKSNPSCPPHIIYLSLDPTSAVSYLAASSETEAEFVTTSLLKLGAGWLFVIGPSSVLQDIQDIFQFSTHCTRNIYSETKNVCRYCQMPSCGPKFFPHLPIPP